MRGTARRRVRGALPWVLAGIVVLAVGATVWIGARAALALGELESLRGELPTFAASLLEGGVDAEAAESVLDHAAAARALTSDPVWRSAEVLPWIGPQLSAAATVSAAADDVARALVGDAGVFAVLDISALAPHDGAVDLDALTALADPLQTAASTTASAAASVGRIDRVALLPTLRTAVDEVSAMLDSAATALDGGAELVDALPALLGAEGPREYLVLFQNNAEWRSLGGNPGAMVVLRIDAGRVELGAQAGTADFPRFAEPVLPLPRSTVAVYGERAGMWMQNVTQIPDFRTGAPLAARMWELEFGHPVDGVIALDTVALGSLLAATGPVSLGDGTTLESSTAVDELLGGVYARVADPVAQDAYFASVAAAVFDAVMSGSDPLVLVRALAAAAEQGRLLVWSADPAEQSLVDGSTVAGGPSAETDDRAVLGVYLNDGTGSKMDYYLRATVDLAWSGCPAPDRTATATIRLENTAGPEVAALPWYVTGGLDLDIDPGVARTIGYLRLPSGSELVSAALSSGGGFGGGVVDGRRVLSYSLDLAPGERAEVVIELAFPDRVPAELDVEMTPTVHFDGTHVVAARCVVP